MALSSDLKFLPYGKQYHIFFYDWSSAREMEWTKDVLKDIEAHGYIGGCYSQNYKASLSVCGNFCKMAEQSVVLAFVFSKDSTKEFNHYVQNIVMYNIKKQMERPMMPILLDDSDVPECLISFEPLNVFNERKYWWPKLLKSLVAEIPSSSSGESDEELGNLHDNLIDLLPEKNKRKQKWFRNMCKQSGLSNFMGHAKRKETNGGLTDNRGEGFFPQSQRPVQ